VKGNGVAATDAPAAPETTPGVGDACFADAQGAELVASNDVSVCGPCTILCPYPLHLVQKKNCECKCEGNAS